MNLVKQIIFLPALVIIAAALGSVGGGIVGALVVGLVGAIGIFSPEVLVLLAKLFVITGAGSGIGIAVWRLFVADDKPKPRGFDVQVGSSTQDTSRAP